MNDWWGTKSGVKHSMKEYAAFSYRGEIEMPELIKTELIKIKREDEFIFLISLDESLFFTYQVNNTVGETKRALSPFYMSIVFIFKANFVSKIGNFIGFGFGNGASCHASLSVLIIK